jgi:hypothetical protein
VGPGKSTKSGKPIPVGVEPGERIAFLRWHQEHRPGKAASSALEKMSTEIGEDVCLIRQADILFSYDGNVTVDV